MIDLMDILDQSVADHKPVGIVPRPALELFFFVECQAQKLAVVAGRPHDLPRHPRPGPGDKLESSNI